MSELSPQQPEVVTPKSSRFRKVGTAVLASTALVAAGKLASMPTTAFGKEVKPQMIAQDGKAGSQDRHEIGGGVLSYNSRGGHAETVAHPVIDHGELGAIDSKAEYITDQGHGDPDKNGALSSKETPPARGGSATSVESPYGGARIVEIPVNNNQETNNDPNARGGQSSEVVYLPDESHIMQPKPDSQAPKS